MTLLSGDESETSVDPSSKTEDNEEDDDLEDPAAGDNDDDDDDDDDDENEGRNSRQDDDGNYVKNSLPNYSSVRPMQSSSSTPLVGVGLGVLKRSPIKLRLRQTAPTENDAHGEEKSERGQRLEGEAGTSGKSGKTTAPTKRKGKAALYGGKRKNTDKAEVETKDAEIGMSSTSQRKRQKL